MYSFPDPLTEVARKIGRHEAGHWVIGNRLGFRGGDILISLHHEAHYTGHAVITLEADLTSIDLIKSYLRRRIIVLFAGSLAEGLDKKGEINIKYAINELTKRGAVNDHKGVRELLRVLRGIEYGAPPEKPEKIQAQLDQLNDTLWEEAISLVRADHEVVLRMADLIAENFEKPGKPFGFKERALYKVPEVAIWMKSLPSKSS